MMGGAGAPLPLRPLHPLHAPLPADSSADTDSADGHSAAAVDGGEGAADHPLAASATSDCGATSGPGLGSRLALPCLTAAGYELTAVVQGESIGEVLSRANHRADDMLRAVGAAAAAAVSAGDMAPEVGQRLLSTYTARMHGYT